MPMQIEDFAISPEFEEEAPLYVDAKPSRRILAGLTDYFIVLFVGMIFYSLLVNIVTHGPLVANVNEEMNLVVDEQLKSYLSEETNEGRIKTPEQMKFTYASRIAAYGGSEESKDCLYRFYCLYEAEEGKDLWTVSDFNEQILKIGEQDSLFVSIGEGKPGALKEELRLPLQVYVAAEDPSQIQEAEPLNAYRTLMEFYEPAFNDAWAILMKSSPVNEHFIAYANASTIYYLALTSTALGSYILSCAIFLYLVPCIHKKGTTLGKKVMKLEPRKPDGNHVSWGSIFLRATMDLFVYSSCLPFVPMFIYGVDGFSMPLMAVGSFVVRLSSFFLFGLLFAVTTLLFTLIRKDHWSLSCMISSTKIVTTDMSLISAEREKIRLAKEREKEGGAHGREDRA